MEIIEVNMELLDLYTKIADLKRVYKENRNTLILNYVKENARFSIGDYIGNVTGTILIENIGYEYSKKFKTLEITYIGKRYWKSKGEFILTKNQRRLTTLREEHCKLMSQVEKT